MLRLVPNDPLDLETLGALLSDQDQLFLVWPVAKFPFDAAQWRERLTARPGNRSYFVTIDNDTIGHAALLETEEPGTLEMSYLFVRPDRRGHGFGKALVVLLEREARTFPGAGNLRLRVRSYNPRAAHVYEAAGFARVATDDTLVLMRKSLALGQLLTSPSRQRTSPPCPTSRSRRRRAW